MKVAIASDHGGFDHKQALFPYLIELGHEVIDMGPDNSESVDYPDYAALVARAVASGEVDRGILICGTGVGMAIAANKIDGIRAANVTSAQFAILVREHNDANVLTLSGRHVDLETNMNAVKAFLQAEFMGGRHARRVAKIMDLQSD